MQWHLFSKQQNIMVLPGYTNDVTMGWKIKVAFFPNLSGCTTYVHSQQDLKHLAFLIMGEFMGFTNDTAYKLVPCEALKWRIHYGKWDLWFSNMAAD